MNCKLKVPMMYLNILCVFLCVRLQRTLRSGNILNDYEANNINFLNGFYTEMFFSPLHLRGADVRLQF